MVLLEASLAQQPSEKASASMASDVGHVRLARVPGPYEDIPATTEAIFLAEFLPSVYKAIYNKNLQCYKNMMRSGRQGYRDLKRQRCSRSAFQIPM